MYLYNLINYFYHDGAGEPVVSDCMDGELRLVGGATVLEGRVEVCMNHAWGGICDYSWSSTDASVVCNQLGFQRAGKYYICIVKVIPCTSYL